MARGRPKKVTFLPSEIDRARKTVKQTKDLGFLDNYMGGSLQALREQVDLLIDEFGEDAVYDIDMSVGHGWYDERHVEISQSVKFTAPESDAEVSKRLNKELRDRVNAEASQQQAAGVRAAARQAKKDAKQAEKDALQALADTLGVAVPKRKRKKKAA